MILIVVVVTAKISCLRRFENRASNPHPVLEANKDQMSKNENDESLVDNKDAKLAQLNMERRIIADTKNSRKQTGGIPHHLPKLVVATVFGLLVLIITGVYMLVGQPKLTSTSNTVTKREDTTVFDQLQEMTNSGQIGNMSVQKTSSPQAGDVEELIVKLEARLEKNTQDVSGWRMLAWSHFNMQRYHRAAQAYAKAVAISEQDAELWSAYAEALVRAANGLVTSQAMNVLDRTLALKPGDARARFFMGLAKEQAGQPEKAIEVWIAILDNAPEDAAWLKGLRTRVMELAAASSIDLSGRLGTPQSAILAAKVKTESNPDAGQIQAALAKPAAERKQMKRNMVDRLANQLEEMPDDADGWIKLMRARLVLGEKDAALAALVKATNIFANKPQLKSRIRQAAIDLGIESR